MTLPGDPVACARVLALAEHVVLQLDAGLTTCPVDLEAVRAAQGQADALITALQSQEIPAEFSEEVRRSVLAVLEETLSRLSACLEVPAHEDRRALDTALTDARRSIGRLRSQLALHQCDDGDVSDCTVQCDRGHAGSCVNLGYAYHLGEGAPVDLARAVHLYRRACDGGDTVGCNNLGVMYMDGEGVARDDGAAIGFFLRGCDAGEPRSCNGVGWMTEIGRGAPRDRAAAASYYAKSCDGNDVLGCMNLAFLAQEGVGMPRDEVRASALRDRACASRARECGRAASRWLQSGRDEAQKARGREYRHMACAAGDTESCAGE